jgi:hypothetical protein
MMMRRFATLTLLLFLAAAGARAQKLADDPGYLRIQELDLFPSDKLSVEVNIEGALLRMVAAATRKEDPEFSAIVAGLKSIQVQVLPATALDANSLRGRIGRVLRLLEDRGWSSTLRVKEKDEETYIYLKELDGKIAGLTLLSLEPGNEAVLINIAGRIDPAQIGRLGQSLDIPALSGIRTGETKKQDKKKE